MDLRPTALHTNTNGDSIAASPAANAALSSDATSTATTGITQAQRKTAALGDTAMDLRPTALHTNTNGDSIAASPAAPNAALSSDATATTGITQAQRETAALGDTAMDLRPTALHTNGDLIAASPAAPNAALSSDVTSMATTGITQAQRETAALGDTMDDITTGASTTTELVQPISEYQADMSKRQAIKSKRRRDEAVLRGAAATTKPSMAGVAEASLEQREPDTTTNSADTPDVDRTLFVLAPTSDGQARSSSTACER
jgi:hypothetical protein